MIFLAIYFFVYILGGLTLLPGILLSYWYFYGARQTQSDPITDYPTNNSNNITTANDRYNNNVKQGWIRLVVVTEPPVSKDDAGKSEMAEFDNGSSRKGNDFFSGPPSSPPTLFYGILRRGTLFCFDNDQQEACHLVLPVHDYNVSLYPKKGRSESELFGRTMSICLTPKTNNTTTAVSDTYYYMSCQRPIDKEDWYFALKSASHQLSDAKGNIDDEHQQHDNSRTDNERDATLFDPLAMSTLRALLDGTSAQVEAQCWNAMMGRLFLGVYKTDTWRQMWRTKMKNKLDKINNFHQHPLQQLAGDHGNNETRYGKGNYSGKRSLMRLLPLQLQLISMGETIPCLTNAKLMEFTTDGSCIIHAQLDYDGDFLVVLRTGLHTLWRPPSSLMSPFEKKKKKKKNKDPPAGTDPPPPPPPGTSSLPLVLSLKLRHCSGKVVFKIKPPPTCRVWAAFETMPTMEWQVTPVVLDKQVKWAYVTHLLETKIKELVAETLVMPNMEDFPFYDSGGLGGIFGDTTGESRKEKDATTPTTATMSDVKGTFDNSMVNGGDKDSAIDVDIGKDDDDDDKQQPPMVSTLVQGYMDRIRNPHKYPPTLSSLDPTAKV